MIFDPGTYGPTFETGTAAVYLAGGFALACVVAALWLRRRCRGVVAVVDR